MTDFLGSPEEGIKQVNLAAMTQLCNLTEVDYNYNHINALSPDSGCWSSGPDSEPPSPVKTSTTFSSISSSSSPYSSCPLQQSRGAAAAAYPPGDGISLLAFLQGGGDDEQLQQPQQQMEAADLFHALPPHTTGDRTVLTDLNNAVHYPVEVEYWAAETGGTGYGMAEFNTSQTWLSAKDCCYQAEGCGPATNNEAGEMQIQVGQNVYDIDILADMSVHIKTEQSGAPEDVRQEICGSHSSTTFSDPNCQYFGDPNDGNNNFDVGCLRCFENACSCDFHTSGNSCYGRDHLTHQHYQDYFFPADTPLPSCPVPAENPDGRLLCKSRRQSVTRTERLWEFILRLLGDPHHNPTLIEWVDRDDGTFRLNNSKAISHMWGMRKSNGQMTYEKLSRALRYYYHRRILEPVLGKKLVYRFGPNAVQVWENRVYRPQPGQKAG